MSGPLEFLDDTPIALPVRFTRPKTLSEQIKLMVRSEELARAAEGQGFETFDEANDFDCGDDQELMTPYEVDGEMVFPKEAAIKEARRVLDEHRAARKAALAAKTATPEVKPEEK